MTWGAALQDLRLDGHDAPLVLGFDRFEDYPAHSPYFGAIAGRYANRIAGGRFTIAGQRVPDRHAISSASTRCMAARQGFGKRVWEVALHGDDFVTLRAASIRTARWAFPARSTSPAPTA